MKNKRFLQDTEIEQCPTHVVIQPPPSLTLLPRHAMAKEKAGQKEVNLRVHNHETNPQTKARKNAFDSPLPLRLVCTQMWDLRPSYSGWKQNRIPIRSGL
jgi:hypothetical protein